jgi:hypothetical protein
MHNNKSRRQGRFYGVGILAGYIYWWVIVRPQPTNKSSKRDAVTGAPS